MFVVRMSAKMPGVRQAMEELGVTERGDVQSFATQRILLHMRRYMPWLSGEMATGHTQQTAPAEITVQAPQARYLYMGSKMRDHNGGGPFPLKDEDGKFTGEFRYRKGAHPVATGIPLEYTHTVNPAAGDHWDQTLMQEEGATIASEIIEYARRRRRLNG